MNKLIAIVLLCGSMAAAQTNISAGTINNVVQAYGQPGANAGAKIINCFAKLQALGGGTCDATGLKGGVISSNIWAGITVPIVLKLGVGTFTDSSCWIMPNDGASLPRQPTFRILGAGYDATATGSYAPTSGTIINNSCSTGVAKLDTRGAGTLEMAGITWMDTSGGSLPFFQTTNTVALIHDNMFYGSKTGTANNQDAIVFGGTTTNLDGSSTAAFQGYGSYVEHNFFNHVRRIFYGRTYCNGVTVNANTVWNQAGSNLAGGAAIEFVATSSSNFGNVVRDNLIEVVSYPYAIKFTQAGFNNTIAANNQYDETGTHLAGVRFEGSSSYNYVQVGAQNDSYADVSEDAGSLGTNMVINSHQTRTSVFPQLNKFTAGGGVQMVTNSVGSPMYNMKLSTTSDEWYMGLYTVGGTSLGFNVNPAGGGSELIANLRRFDANQYALILNGPATSFIQAGADMRLRATGTLWLGTFGNATGLLLNDTNAKFNNATMYFINGDVLSGYSDNTITQKWSINSANGLGTFLGGLSVTGGITVTSGVTTLKNTNITVANVQQFTSGYNGVAFSATPVFDCSVAGNFEMTLTANVTSATFANCVSGQILTFVINQDGTGGRTWVWGPLFNGADVIGATANKSTVQQFIIRATDGHAMAISAAKTNI